MENSMKRPSGHSGTSILVSPPIFGLAFLQNMWVRDPKRVRSLIETYGECYRERLLRHALFAGCLTGKRLKQAFGNDLLELIHFEEASREIHGDHSTVGKPDSQHIKSALLRHPPQVVLTFGQVATRAVSPHWNGVLIQAPHPAARGGSVKEQLEEAAKTFSNLWMAGRASTV